MHELQKFNLRRAMQVARRVTFEHVMTENNTPSLKNQDTVIYKNRHFLANRYELPEIDFEN